MSKSNTQNTRAVFTLKVLNPFVQSEHFKMESIQMAKHLVQEGNVMISLDPCNEGKAN